MTSILLGEFALTVCQKNEWNVLFLEASHRLKSQHSEDANLQSGVRDMTERIFILTRTKHKLKVDALPISFMLDTGAYCFLCDRSAAQLSRKTGPVLILLPLCSTAKGSLFSSNGDMRPDLCCCNSCSWQDLCCIASALERLQANSQATVWNPDSSPYTQ